MIKRRCQDLSELDIKNFIRTYEREREEKEKYYLLIMSVKRSSSFKWRKIFPSHFLVSLPLSRNIKVIRGWRGEGEGKGPRLCFLEPVRKPAFNDRSLRRGENWDVRRQSRFAHIPKPGRINASVSSMHSGNSWNNEPLKWPPLSFFFFSFSFILLSCIILFLFSKCLFSEFIIDFNHTYALYFASTSKPTHFMFFRNFWV